MLKYFLVGGSILSPFLGAQTASAWDITLGGELNFGMDYGLNADKALQVFESHADIRLELKGAKTLDSGLRYGFDLSLGHSEELKFIPYVSGTGSEQVKYMVRLSADAPRDIKGVAYATSGGAKVSSNQIVGVKINSAWHTVADEKIGKYSLELDQLTASNFCKLAGKGTAGSYLGDRYFDQTLTLGDGYFPVQQVLSGSFFLTAQGLDAAAPPSTGAYQAPAAAVHVYNVPGDDYFTVGNLSQDSRTVDGDQQVYGYNVTNAVVFMGPFLEVALRSSTTKLAVGAVCVEREFSSATHFHFNHVTPVLTASDAKIFVEGGFGRLDFQLNDHSGHVTPVMTAGDAADLKVDGLGLIATLPEAYGVQGALGLDLGDAKERLVSATVGFGNYDIAGDILWGDGSGAVSWDIGLDYDHESYSTNLAFDSDGDFGMAANWSRFGVDFGAVWLWESVKPNEKTGVQYAITAGTTLNGIGMAAAYDNQGDIALGLDIEIGAATAYASYSSLNHSGVVGMKLEF